MDFQTFESQIRETGEAVVVDLWAPWCGPCKAIEPALKQLEARYGGQVKLLRLNADEHPEVLRGLGVFSIPTLLAYKGGAEVTRRTGAASQAVLDGLFQAALLGQPTPAQRQVSTGPTQLDRLVRLTLGMVLFSLGLVNLFSLGGSTLVSGGIILLGMGVGFLAVYDRCPVYRAISGWVKAQLKSGS